jgi:hypothetical protein
MPFEKCPCCAGNTSSRIRFTLWGGAIGPALLSLVQCATCGIHYNGKHGTRVEKTIRLYTCIMFTLLITLAACVVYAYAGSPTPPGTI